MFDAGVSETHRPYFVMELVSGVPFTEYADTHKLSTRERLELFIGICDRERATCLDSRRRFSGCHGVGGHGKRWLRR